MAILLTEAYRHSKALGAWGSGAGVLGAAGIPEDAPGILVESPEELVPGLITLLGQHRVWERFPVAAA